MMEVLKVIADHNEKFSWYQIDRHLAVRGSDIIKSGMLMKLLNRLLQEGYIIEMPSQSGEPAKYSITSRGRSCLANNNN